MNMQYAVILNVSSQHFVSAYLRARNTGPGTYFQGSARDNDDFMYKRVPPISYTNRQGVRLMNNHVIDGNLAFLFELATGGAATMPAELVIGIS